MKILVLVAGTNTPSNCDFLADTFIEGMKTCPAMNVEKIRVNDLEIEHFRLEHYKPDFAKEPDFAKIEKAMLESDGFVVATPVWNFGVPAHLKNLIDRMGSFGLDTEKRSRGQLKGKPFYLIFTGGAPKAAWKGLMRFTTGFVTAGFEYFDTTHIGTHYEGKCMRNGEFKLVVDQRPESLKKVKRKGTRFIQIVEQLEKTGRLPAWKRIYRWGYRIGQRIVAKL